MAGERGSGHEERDDGSVDDRPEAVMPSDGDRTAPDPTASHEEAGRGEPVPVQADPSASSIDGLGVRGGRLDARRREESTGASPTGGRPSFQSGPARRAWRDRVRLPDRARFAIGAGARREVVGLAVLGVLTVLCAVLVIAVLIKTRDDAAVAAREAADYSPPPLTSASPGPTGPVIAVIADETASRAAPSVSADDRWPQVLGDALDAVVLVRAGPGAGYATGGSDGASFVDLAASVPEDAQVVLFVGGAADASVSSLAVAKGATSAFSEAAEQAPNASVVAVGPFFRGADVPESEDGALRAALRSSAKIAGVRWVDPQKSEWLTGVDSTSQLSAAAERTIAARIETLVRSETD